MFGPGLLMPPIHQAAGTGGGISLWPLIAFAAFILGLGTGRWLLPGATPPDHIGPGPGGPPTGHPYGPDPMGGSCVDDIERWLWEGARGVIEPGASSMASDRRLASCFPLSIEDESQDCGQRPGHGQWRAAVQVHEVNGGRRAPGTDCPPTFENTDICAVTRQTPHPERPSSWARCRRPTRAASLTGRVTFRYAVIGG